MKYLRHVHLVVANHVLRYLKGMIEYGLRYVRYQRIFLQGYVESYWVGSATYRKSTSDCCFSLGYSMTSLFNKKHKSVAVSTTEEEYIAAC